MITQHNVLALLRQLTQLEPQEEAAALSMCLSSLEQIQSRLRPDAPQNDVRIGAAAAAGALCSLCSHRMSAGGVTGFKAGDISVQRDGEKALKAARILRDDALLAALPLLRDEGFLFCGVDI